MYAERFEWVMNGCVVQCVIDWVYYTKCLRYMDIEISRWFRLNASDFSLLNGHRDEGLVGTRVVDCNYAY